MAFNLQLREDRPATIEEHRALRAENERLKATIKHVRDIATSVAGWEKHGATIYLSAKTVASLASAGEQKVDP